MEENTVTPSNMELLQQNTFLKIELMNAVKSHLREVEDLKSMYESKREEVQSELRTLKIKHDTDKRTKEEEVENLKNITITLEQKLKLAEEDRSSALDENKKLTLKLKDLAVKFEDMKVQKEVSLQKHKDAQLSLQESLKKAEELYDNERIQRHELDIEMSALKHKYSMLKCRLDEVEQQFKIDINASKVEVERSKEMAKIAQQEYKSHIAELSKNLEEERILRTECEEKFGILETDVEQKVKSLKQKHLEESQALMKENEELLQRLQGTGNFGEGAFLYDDEVVPHMLKDKSEEEEAALIKENKLLKGRIDILTGYEKELKEEREKQTRLHSDLTQTAVCLKSSKEENKKLSEERNVLKDERESLKKEVESLSSRLALENRNYGEKLTELRKSNSENVVELKSRLKDMETVMHSKSQKFLKEDKRVKTKLKTYRELIKKLRFKLETSKLREKDLSNANDLFLHQYVPFSTHRALQVKTAKLAGKHDNFRTFITKLIEASDRLNQVTEISEGVRSVGRQLVELESLQQQALSNAEQLSSK